MKGVLKVLARLYPAEWRRRYGVEYEALLEEGTPRVRDVVDVFWGAFKMQMTSWSFVRIVLVCSVCGALAAVAVSFVAPKRYLSQTLILVQTPEPQAIDKYLAGQVKDLLSPEFLTSIIERENLYPDERARMPMSDVVNMMRKGIWIAPANGKPGSAFTIAFTYPDPHVAQRVDAELTSGLMTLNTRAEAAYVTREYLKYQAAAAKDPATKAVMERKLRQAVAAPSYLPVPLRVLNVASLPKKPVFPKPGIFGVGGLMVGLVGGVVAAAGVGWRRRVTVMHR